MGYELILGKFENTVEAAEAQLERYQSSQDEAGIAEAVAIVKTADGVDEVKLMGDPKKKGRRIGAIAGAMLGVLGGPPAMVVLGLGGAAVGNLIANLTHAGVSKKMIESVEEGLEPGSSAVIVIVEGPGRNLVVKDLKEHGAIIMSEAIESHEIEGKYLISPSGGISETQ
jgi:uncharacterized membrane protein